MEIHCGIYRIREGTKEEFIAIGSNGRVVRWGETNGLEQDWVILPAGKNRYKFLTCQQEKRQDNECMAVGSNGDVARWSPTSGSEQVFSFTNPNSDGWFNIQEHTHSEYLGVGSDGKVCRWGWTGGKDQLFKLEAKSIQKEPEVKKGEYEPRQIPDIPRLTDFRQPPKTSQLYLIGEVIYPAFFVNDDHYRSKVTQIENNPYYILRREQYWHNEYYREFDGNTSEETSVRMKVGVSNITGQSMEYVLGMKVTTNFEMGFNPELEAKGIKIKGQNEKQSFSSELTNQLKLTRTEERSEISEYEETIKITFPAGKRFAKAVWILCDRFTIFNKNNAEVGQWEVRSKDTIVEDSYPKN